MYLLRGLVKDGLTVKALVVQPVVAVKPGLVKSELDSAGWQLDIRLMEEPGSDLPGDLTGFNALVILGSTCRSAGHCLNIGLTPAGNLIFI